MCTAVGQAVAQAHHGSLAGGDILASLAAGA